MDRTRIAYLIQKFRSNQATREEIAELEKFWQVAQEDDTLFNVLTDEEKEATRTAMLRRIRSRIAATERRTATRPALSWTLRIAASVTVLVALAVFYFADSSSENLYRTAYGEQHSVLLPDGSEVVLNGNSALRYAATWKDTQDREVWIEGEAFFEVTHKVNNQKFIVHTPGGMNVQVLGTKFNVKVRRGRAEVMLQEGQVRLEIEKKTSTEQLTLVPGELVTLVNDQISRSKVSANEYAGWKENRLTFDQTPLYDIAAMLEDTYGMQIEFSDSVLSGRRLSGEIIADNARDILDAIKETMGLTIREYNDRLIFATTENKAN